MEEQKANPADHNGVDSAVGGRHVGWYVDDVCGDARRGRIGAYEAGRKVDRLVGVQRHYRPRITLVMSSVMPLAVWGEVA